ncbi:MAG: hypothetical protein ACXWA9_21025 [Acidimicrobiia bacterium]
MEDAKWERWSALGGIVFVVLILVAGFMPGTPPKTGDSAAKIANFVTDKGDELRWAGFIGALAVVALFWFLGGVWRVLRRAEGGNPRLTVVALSGALFASVMATIGGIGLGVLGITGVAGTGGPNTTRFVYIFSTNLAVATAFGLAIFVASFSAVILRSGFMPKALGWIGAVIALVALASGGIVASTRDVFFDLSFAAFAAFSLWLLIVSVLMLRGAGSEPPAVSAT